MTHMSSSHLQVAFLPHLQLQVMMDIASMSSTDVFALLGFSAWQSLEPVLFVIVSGFYVLSAFVNGVITLVSCVDVCLHSLMYFFLDNFFFMDISFTTSTVLQLLVNHRKP